MALLWHPDKHQKDQQKATDIFKMLLAAYQELSDVNRRKAYDRKMEAQRQQIPKTIKKDNSWSSPFYYTQQWRPATPFWDRLYTSEMSEHHLPSVKPCGPNCPHLDKSENPILEQQLRQTEANAAAAGATYLGYKPWSTNG